MSELSIIIVNYKVKEELFLCIRSLLNSKTKTLFEIIVIDNDEEKSLGKDIKNKFPKVKYFHSKTNVGFGGGNNIGAAFATGKYLYFLNPDTEIFSNSIDILVNFFKKNKNVAIVAPILLDEQKNIIPFQGAKTLTPVRSIFAFTLISRIFPNNIISNNFWIKNWNRKTDKKVESVPGTAFIIKRSVFEEVHGFDENFFLYFEEYDLCKRVKDRGYDIFLLPQAKVVHKMGRSTSKKGKEKIANIFEASRTYYFKKNFGILNSLMVNLFFGINKKNTILLMIVFLGFFLRVYKIDDFMTFIGDQGWFYLSARDLVLSEHIPLVGISSSHPWLHQGALWTYFLAIVLWLGKFNPVSGAYLSTFLGIVGIILIYKFCSENFSQRIGLIASFLYATSALIVVHDRIPYHTSPIPLFTIIYFIFLTKWINGRIFFFPLIFLILSILYSFELATIIIFPSLFLIFLYGFFKKKAWFKNIINLRIVALSITLLLIPLIPMLIYDIENGFPQTVKFLLWLGYRFLIVIGVFQRSILERSTFNDALFFFFDSYKKIVFIPSLFFSLFILFSSIFLATIKIFSYVKEHKANNAFVVLYLTTIIAFVGFAVNKVPSGAYLPIMYPGIIILVSFVVDSVFKKSKSFAIFFLFFLVFSNIGFLLKSDFLTSKKTNTYTATLKERIDISKHMISVAGKEEYSIEIVGVGSEFESSVMNYQYLTWWLGKEALTEKQKIKFIIDEKSDRIILKKADMIR